MTDTPPPTPAADPPPPAPRPKAPRKAGSATRDGAASRAPRKRKAAEPPPPPPPPPPPSLWWAGGVALGIVALDQLTKWIVVQALNLVEVQAIDVLDPWLNLRMAWNQGVNFGLLASSEDVMRWVLVAVALAICVWVGVWLVRVRPGRLAQVAAGLLIGGALGNVIDRIAYGAVADFLNMSFPGWRNPYSFNVADIAIFAGALGLVFQPGPARVEKAAAAGADKTRDAQDKTR